MPQNFSARPPTHPLQATGQALRAYTETWNAEKLRERMREKHGADPLDDAEAEATKAELRDLAQEFGERAAQREGAGRACTVLMKGG